MLTPTERERYDRQITLDEVGLNGQEKLAHARVLICGAGGLGSPASLYLAAAGIGNLVLVDHDCVSLSNLNRQILHGERDIGRLKVHSAKDRLQQIRSDLVITPVSEKICAANIDKIICGSDVILDALDSIPDRMILNGAAVRQGIPLVHGAVQGFEGRVLTILPGRGACLGCIRRNPSDFVEPASRKFPVIGVVPAVIGAIQATEAVKLILNAGRPLVNRLLRYDALSMSWTEYRLKRNPDCASCGNLINSENSDQPAGA
jgi:adenylyltransferase/sulfurtransferase